MPVKEKVSYGACLGIEENNVWYSIIAVNLINGLCSDSFSYMSIT
jgi:hypothetical protein